MVYIVPVPTKKMSQYHNNCIHSITTLMLYLLNSCLHHCIFPNITSAVSIPMPLPQYPFYQCHWHQIHCCSSTSDVSNTRFTLWCIYNNPPPMLLYPLSYHQPGIHCTILSATIFADKIMMSPFHHDYAASLLPLTSLWWNFCIHLNIRLNFYLVALMYQNMSGEVLVFRTTNRGVLPIPRFGFFGLTKAPLLWPMFHWPILSPVDMPSWNSVSHVIPPFYIYLVPKIIQA